MRSSRTGAGGCRGSRGSVRRSEEHTSELQSLAYLVCRLLLEKKNKKIDDHIIKQERRITFSSNKSSICSWNCNSNMRRQSNRTTNRLETSQCDHTTR